MGIAICPNACSNRRGRKFILFAFVKCEVVFGNGIKIRITSKIKKRFVRLLESTTPHRYVRLNTMTRQQVLDIYFMDARSKLIDLAAFLDRVERSTGDEDFRMHALREALKELEKGNSDRAKRVLLSLSDPTEEPIAKAPGKGAIGAWSRNG